MREVPFKFNDKIADDYKNYNSRQILFYFNRYIKIQIENNIKDNTKRYKAYELVKQSYKLEKWYMYLCRQFIYQDNKLLKIIYNKIGYFVYKLCVKKLYQLSSCISDDPQLYNDICTIRALYWIKLVRRVIEDLSNGKQTVNNRFEVVDITNS